MGEHKKGGQKMIGAIIGDIVGSIYEWSNHKNKVFELFQSTMFFTDDSVFTLGIADALLKNQGKEEGLQSITVETMQRLGRKYPYAGWGDHQLRWIFSENPIPYNSLGNGSGMRVSAVAYVGQTLDEVIRLSDLVTTVTHNHPEGMKAARAIAGATFLALMTRNKEKIKTFITHHIGYDMSFTLDEIRPVYRYDVTAPGSTPQAIQAFLESTSFEDAIRNAISIGGDSDTIAAMTGAIAGAYYGVDDALIHHAMDYLTEDLKSIYLSFKKAFID